MSDNIANDMSKLALSLKETLECPVCLKLPQQIPIYQCDNGHIICKSCRAQLDTCPQCRRPLGTSRCLMAERFLEAFPEPCQFTKNGCAQILVPYQVEDHAKECAFREVECPIGSCERKFVITKLNDHIKSSHSHGVDLFVSSTEGKYSGAIGMHSNSWWHPDLITFNDTLFLHMLQNGASNSRYLWVYGIGSEKEMSKFSFKLRLYHPDFENEIICKSRVTSVDCPKAEVIAGKQCVYLAEESLLRVTKDEFVEYDIEIVEKSPVASQH